MPWDPKKGLLQLQIDLDLFDELDKLAEQDQISRAAEVRKLLELGIQRRSKLLRSLGVDSLSEAERVAFERIASE